MIQIRPVIRGLLSYTPLLRLINKGKGTKGTGGTNSAKYCYSVWLRHVVTLYNSGLFNNPEVVAEFGTGDSLGIGLSSLLTGANTYYAFDSIQHSDIKFNLEIFAELVKLFRAKTNIPNDVDFPFVYPKLNDYSFPEYIFSDNQLFKMLDEERHQEIRKAIIGEDSDITIKYIVPWDNKDFKLLTVDLIISQAVMEHIVDIENSYRIMYGLLSQNGTFTHTIDYSAHETHKVWNGHWTYSNTVWNIIMHGRSYPISRLPHSKHAFYIRNAGFKIINEIIDYNKTGYDKCKLNKKFKNINNDDLIIKSAVIQGKK